MTTTGRRKDDLVRARVLLAITALAVASSLLASYVSYRALRMMSGIEATQEEIFKLGRSMRPARREPEPFKFDEATQ